MQRPFFTIITRTFPGREKLLERCQYSVAIQTIGAVNIEHLILRDELGAGVSQAQLLMHQASPRGEYVLVLDDDDFLTADDVLELVQRELALKRPCFAVVKVKHGWFGEMPLVWGDGRVPQEGEITVSNVVVEHVQWRLHRKCFTQEYAGDFKFIKSLFDAHKPLWIDVDVVTVEKMRNGAVA